MAFKSRRYKCPECSGEFSFLHEIINGVEEDPPSHCPRCGCYVGTEPQALPSNFSISSSKGKNPDILYREMESSSADRAQQAADLAGVPVSEMASLKITNMKDNMREGDIAAIVPPQPSQAYVQATRQTNSAPAFQANGAEYARGTIINGSAIGTMVGPSAGHHGESMRERVTNFHKSLVPVQRRVQNRAT